jgi:general secretion pathway protein G
MVSTERRDRESGFTLIEMIIVITIIGILAGIALPRVQVALRSSREAVLKEDLFRFREAIDQYHADKGNYPASLQTLVDEGYLRRLEPDPITGAADWEEVFAETNDSNPDEAPGVYDVHSASTEIGLNGEAYNLW